MEMNEELQVRRALCKARHDYVENKFAAPTQFNAAYSEESGWRFEFHDEAQWTDGFTTIHHGAEVTDLFWSCNESIALDWLEGWDSEWNDD